MTGARLVIARPLLPSLDAASSQPCFVDDSFEVPWDWSRWLGLLRLQKLLMPRLLCLWLLSFVALEILKLSRSMLHMALARYMAQLMTEQAGGCRVLGRAAYSYQQFTSVLPARGSRRMHILPPADKRAEGYCPTANGSGISVVTQCSCSRRLHLIQAVARYTPPAPESNMRQCA